MELKNAEILAVGKWNGVTFTAEDLDGIVASFAALKLNGRVPLKIGHDADHKKDDAPALGWVERVWRDGNKLLADFVSIPEKLMSGIREGLYKFVSVELLRDVSAGTRQVPWVLDAVAILGATQPAVGILKDLQSLTFNSKRTFYKFAERVSFSLEGKGVNTNEQELTTKLINSRFNEAIASGRITPADRQRFTKLFPNPTAENCETFLMLAASKPAQREGQSQTVGTPSGGRREGTPDVQIARLARERQHAYRKDYGKELSLLDATLDVIRDPAHAAAVEEYKQWCISMHSAKD